MVLGVILVLCFVVWIVATRVSEREFGKDNKHPFWRRGDYFSTNLEEEGDEQDGPEAH